MQAETSPPQTVTFLGTELHTAPETLVPRAETELLATTALSVLRETGTAQPRVIDMCCGIGNLAVVIARAVPDARVWAADLTRACVEATRHNAHRYQLDERLVVVQGDLFAALDGLALEGSIDLIVCNPPYISTSRLEGESAHLLEHEPREAFDAGPYGLSIHQRVARTAAAFLRPGGHLLFEFGAGQARQVQLLLERTRAYDITQLVPAPPALARVALARRRHP